MKNVTKSLLGALLLSASMSAFAQKATYTSSIVGDPADVSTPTTGGALLMGGGADNDDAMRWMLAKSGGGDIVVLRAAGTDGYNAYLYGLATCNSVETLIISSRTAANDPVVAQKIRNAEAVFIAGGDQNDYVTFWKDTEVEFALNYLINTKGVVVGGTSAGCAIQGASYFDAANGTTRTEDALADPYNANLTLQRDNFISHPKLANTITDTHYDNPDRRGRHTTFMARMIADWGIDARGIGVDEVTAVCVEPDGTARVFGDLAFEDYAYFLQVEGGAPETCAPGTPLTWDRSGTAVKVYKIQGDPTGSRTFNLNTWASGNGGSWEYFYACNGNFLQSCSGGGTGGGGTASYCPSRGNDASSEWISLVDIRNLYNSTGSNGGYGDFTSSVGTDLEIGQSYSLYLRPGFNGSSSYTEHWMVWIDFNRDGDFDDAGENVASGRSRRAISRTVSIPSSATAGNTRMRVSMSYDGYPTPCESIRYGEVEDYTVNLFQYGARMAASSARPSGGEAMAYPNPARGQISLRLQEQEGTPVEVSIYTIAGQLLRRTEASYADGMSVSLEGIPAGQYLLQAQGQDGRLVQRIQIMP